MSNTPINIDALAQEIRRVDGNHDKGAGALAEALMPFLTAALQSAADTPAPQTHVVGIRAQAIEDVLSALTAHELYKYRPKAFEGFIQYARETLVNDEDAWVWRSSNLPRIKPLEWVMMNDGCTYHAQSILGRWARWEDHYLPPDGYGGIPCDDPIAAAQADYERRIRSALASEGQA